MSWNGRNDKIERIVLVVFVCLRIGKRIDDVQEFYERSRPAVKQHEQHCVGFRRSDVEGIPAKKAAALVRGAFAGVASALEKALQMPVSEQQERMRKLRRFLKHANVHRWVREFMDEIESAKARRRAAEKKAQG